jgi:hypothetical protein
MRASNVFFLNSPTAKFIRVGLTRLELFHVYGQRQTGAARGGVPGKVIRSTQQYDTKLFLSIIEI